MAVVEHLKNLGFVAKTPEPLNWGTALGLTLRLLTKGNGLWFSRGNKLPAENNKIERRELFYECGLLVGHYLIAG